jgi:hypothetical protein
MARETRAQMDKRLAFVALATNKGLECKRANEFYTRCGPKERAKTNAEILTDFIWWLPAEEKMNLVKS